MANAHTDSAGADHGSFKSYGIGFILSVILTAIPFWLVMNPVMPKSTTLAVVVILAIVQVLVHLVYFLHLNRSSEQRWNVIAMIFAGVIIAFLVGLSLWIMFSIHHFMMAH